MKAVLDTNVLVSALIKTGKPRELLFRAAEGKFQAILSRQILEEFVKVVRDPKVGRYVDEEDVEAFLRALAAMTSTMKVKSKFKAVKRDPKDDVVLRTAYDSGSDYVVTGDRDLLEIREFRGIRIITVERMLEIVTNEAGYGL